MIKQEIIEEFTEWINQSREEDIKGFFFVLNTKPSLRTRHSGEIGKEDISKGASAALNKR